jgi:hypothetical protein
MLSPREATLAREIQQIWTGVLGEHAEPGAGFLENGGDSFHAILMAARIYEVTGQEIDYLDVLEATGMDSVWDLVARAAAER